MIQTRLTLILILISISSFGQYSFSLDKVKFKGIGLKTTRKIIIEKFGQGESVKTNYECGFFAVDDPKGPYYQMVFDQFKFIGSDRGDFYLQTVDFDSKGKIKIVYGNKVLNGLTTKDKFINMFGEITKKHFDNPDNKAIVLIADGRDDGARFTFRNSRLIKFEYWTPC